MLLRILPSVILILLIFQATAQEEAMRVERCSAINPDSPVANIYVDKDGEKWVSNTEGLWQVHAADLATPLILGSAEESLLQFPGGNKDIRWMKGEINELLGGIIAGDNIISAAYYNEIQDHLWIGTTETGIFLFRTEPKLKWIKEINKRMPKLRSNRINTIYVDGEDDRHFMGTDEGIIAGRGGRWGLEERYFRFQAIAHRGKEVWLLAEDLIWVVDGEENWRSVEIDPEQVRGPIKDIALDREGKLWIASEYLTVFDIENNNYKIFDGADYFTSNDVNCLAVDRDGAIWVGTQDKGLYVIEKESAMTVTCLVENELSCDPEVDDASLIVKIKGGQPPYTYVWENGLTGDNPKNLGVGSYVVTVTDSRGQSKPAEGVVEDTRLKVTVTMERPHDADGRGAAAATVDHGKPKYTFLWDNGENGPRAERLEAGLHSVTVTDVNGCRGEGQVEITREAGDLVASIEKIAGDQCEPGNNKARLNIKGGVGPYTIKWSDPSLSGEEVSGLAAGTYHVSVTDAQQKKVETAVTFVELELMTATASQLKAADLEGKGGSASVDVSGGGGKYRYQWDNGENGPRAERLEAGLHSVTVTDVNGCQAESEVEITRQTRDLVASIQKIAGDQCEPGNNKAKVNIEGGVGPYTIKWSDPSLSGEEVSGLAAGTYHVSVTDAQQKQVEAAVTFVESELMTATASQLKAADLEGKGGSASVDVTGGSGRYRYQWDNGETKLRAQKLDAGSHSVTITDQNDCTTIATVEITQEVAELAAVIERTGKSLCAGDGLNAVKAVVNGGEGPYSYQWRDIESTSAELTSLAAGVYYLTITDSRGATVSTSVNIDELKPLEIEATVHAAATTDNSDGRASVKAVGGTGNYTYSWSNGETTKDATKLAPGKHQITVKDEAGCSASAEVNITENISEIALFLNKVADVKCAGDENGAIEAVVQGGKGPFEYTWNNAQISGSQAENLAGGLYAVTVTDAIGNVASASVEINIPAKLEIEIVEQRGVTDEASSDGKAEVKVSGGAGGYSYAWDNQYTGDRAENLSLGLHSVTVSDLNGCVAVAEFETKQKILPALSLNKLRSGQVVQMQMLQFDADSTNVNETGGPVLDEVYEFLKDNPGVVIRVEGHTNNVPPDEYCDKLSTARAKSVAEYVVQRGIAGERVYYKGYGKRQPIYSNRTPEGRRKNQRVEIKILEIGDTGS